MKLILHMLGSAECRMLCFQSLLMSCLPSQPWEAQPSHLKALLPSHLHSSSQLSTEACKHKAQPQQWAWETALFLEKRPKKLKTTIFLWRTSSRTITSKSCLEIKPFLMTAFSSSFKSPVLSQFNQRGMHFWGRHSGPVKGSRVGSITGLSLPVTAQSNL